MSGISLNLPKDLSNSLADLAKTSGQSTSHLAVDALRDYIEHEKALSTQIELAVKDATWANLLPMSQWQQCELGAGVRMQVEWLERALKNLEDESNYIALENPKAADDLSAAIFAT